VFLVAANGHDEPVTPEERAPSICGRPYLIVFVPEYCPTDEGPDFSRAFVFLPRRAPDDRRHRQNASALSPTSSFATTSVKH